MKIKKKFLIKAAITIIIEIFIIYLGTDIWIEYKTRNGLIEYYYYVKENYIELEKRIFEVENTIKREDEVMGLLTYSYLTNIMINENKTIEKVAKDEIRFIKLKYGLKKRFRIAQCIKYDKIRAVNLLK